MLQHIVHSNICGTQLHIVCSNKCCDTSWIHQLLFYLLWAYLWYR